MTPEPRHDVIRYISGDVIGDSSPMTSPVVLSVFYLQLLFRCLPKHPHYAARNATIKRSVAAIIYSVLKSFSVGDLLGSSQRSPKSIIARLYVILAYAAQNNNLDSGKLLSLY